MPLNAGSIIEIDLDKPAAGGRMLGRVEGQVVLVSGAIPGERVKARVERVGKGVAYAEVSEVLAASPDRRPTAGDGRCGGNVLAHVGYARQLQLKGQIIQDAFGRIGRLPLASVPDVVGSPEAGYRMRARLHAGDGRLGFYREGTHELCDAAATGQLLPATTTWIAVAEDVLRRERLTGVVAVELAENVAGDRRACHLELQAGADAAPYAALAEGLAGLSAQRIDRPAVEVLAGTPIITDTIGVAPRAAGGVRRQGGLGDGGDRSAAEQPGGSARVTLRRDVRAFFQGNRFLLERVVEHVLALVPPGPVIDLYAGVGLFGLSLAAAGADAVTLVEGDPISGADLKANAAAFRGAVRVERRSVEAYLAASRVGRSTVIVDPPRTGMSRDAVAGIIRADPRTVIYVSCDVATLARDSRVLVDAGYDLGALTAFDLFPNTAHVETVAVFTRGGRA